MNYFVKFLNYSVVLLTDLIERVDKISMIERYLCPLVTPNHKLQQEAQSNASLKEALQRLQLELQGAVVGINGMGIGLK